MTDNNHPITPSQELVDKWVAMLEYCEDIDVFSDIARWGADQELNECCEWIYKLMDRGLEWSMDLRAHRRPKPPSLKAQALSLLKTVETSDDAANSWDFSVVRRALESLPE